MGITDNDLILINDYILGKEVDKDLLEDVKLKLAYEVEKINLRTEFMTRAEALDKKYIKKEDK